MSVHDSSVSRLDDALAGDSRSAPVLEPKRLPREQALMLGGVVASALTFIWVHRFLPLQDLPDWITQGKLFADLLSGKLAAPYTFKAIPVPNAVSSVCIGLLTLWMSPELAAKWVLSGYVVAYAAAVIYLLSASGRLASPPLLAASLLLLLNFSFFHGELNYAFALVVLFAGQGLVLRSAERPSTSVGLRVAVISIVLYFCHGAGYGAWLVFLAAYAWVARTARTCIGFLIAVAPSLVLAAIYAAARSGEQQPILVGWSLSESATVGAEKVWLLFKFLAPFQGFYPFLDTRWTWLLVVANVFAVVIASRGVLRASKFGVGSHGLQQRAILTTLTWYGAAFVLAPRNLGGLFNPAERLVLPAFQLALAAMVPSAAARFAASPRASSCVAWLLLAMQGVYLQLYGGVVSGQLAHAHDRLRGYAHAAPLSVLHESHFRFQAHWHPPRPLPWKLLPMHHPMLRITYYASLEAAQPVSIFETGLFRSTVPRVENTASALAELPARAPVVIVGWQPGNRAIAALMPRVSTRIVTDERTFIVLRPESDPPRQN
jgi:hypothetical protein